MPVVQLVSKAITPPFRDGTKCFVRDLTNHLQSVSPLVLGTGATSPELEATVVPVYGRPGGFAPALRDNAAAFVWLLTRSRADLWHFAFAPNPRSSQMGRVLKALRRIPSLQTVTSPPRSFAQPERLLFGDRVVTQSRWTGAQFEASYRALGLRAPQLDVIPPIAPRVPEPSPEAQAQIRSALGVTEDARLLIYPGDLEMSQGALRVTSLVRELQRSETSARPVVVFAYRNKTARATERARELADSLKGTSARFLPETPHIHALLKTAALILFPVDDLFGKVDLPIVLLEALRLGTPVLTSGEGPLAELSGAEHLPFEPVAWSRAVLERLGGGGARVESAALSRHEPETVGRAYEAIYAELLAGRR